MKTGRRIDRKREIGRHIYIGVGGLSSRQSGRNSDRRHHKTQIREVIGYVEIRSKILSLDGALMQRRKRRDGQIRRNERTRD